MFLISFFYEHILVENNVTYKLFDYRSKDYNIFDQFFYEHILVKNDVTYKLIDYRSKQHFYEYILVNIYVTYIPTNICGYSMHDKNLL